MKGSFYPKFAFSSIRKNKRFYIPYIITSILFVMMFYIVTSLSASSNISTMGGGTALIGILEFGSPVILIFSLIFLFYTSSFLHKRRNKEYALYNIIGMNKRNISHILVWDTVITYIISVGIGLLFGVVFFKLAEIGLLEIIGGDITYNLAINWSILGRTLVYFALIFILVLIKSLFKIRISRPIELLRSSSVGEKPPKGNILLGILGLVLLGIAYYIALTTDNPYRALVLFFIAVILVILGTYLIFIAGSVIVCRVLKKNRGYYYKPNHFVSLSSMVYRMKRNGAGLATICILATMILVMVSTTLTLLFSTEDYFEARFPRQMEISIGTEVINDEIRENVEAYIDDNCKEFGVAPKNIFHYESSPISGYIIDGVINPSWELTEEQATDLAFQDLNLVSIDEYNRVMGTDEVLTGEDVFIYDTSGNLNNASLTYKDKNTYNVVKTLDEFWDDGSSANILFPTIYIVVSNEEYENRITDEIYTGEGTYYIRPRITYTFAFDTDLNEEDQQKLYEEILGNSDDLTSENTDVSQFSIISLVSEKAGFYAIYGGLFFIAVVLSILFIASTVLIIYYKQIVEGYEDKDRFNIMRKVGMTKGEIKKSINSQLLTVFFLPLIVAGVHLCFATPIIKRLIKIFNIDNLMIVYVTIISFLIFAIFYVIVYKITSNTYYRIVSNGDNE